MRFAGDLFLLFTVGVRELKIPRTPDRRITPLFGSGKFGRWPAHALVIVAHIPVPPSHLARLSAGHSPGTTRAAIINAARRAENDALGVRGASGGCVASMSSPRRFPPSWSVEETDPTSISEEELARRSNQRVREDSRGGSAARVGLAHRAFRKGFLTIPNQIVGRQSRVQCCRPASRFRDDTRIDIHRFDYGASSCPGHRGDRHYNAVATGAPGDAVRKAR